jgi:hypothetical protein
MNKCILLIVILMAGICCTNTAKAQLPEPSQDFRGLWVTQFKTTVLGNAAAEDALIAYAVTNNFNYLICTNMFLILTAPCGTFSADMVALKAFIAKAHAEGIAYVSGNVGTLATAEKIQEYNNCMDVSDIERLDMITYECEYYNNATNGNCPDSASFVSQLTAIKNICATTNSSIAARKLVCETYIGGEGATGLVLTNATEAQMEKIASITDHILLTYYRPTPFSSGGNFFNWTIDRLEWISKTPIASNIVLLLKSRNTDGNNMYSYLSSYPGTHYNAVRDPYLSWTEGTAYNPLLTKGYREKFLDGTYPWLSGIKVKGFTWFEHQANQLIGAIILPLQNISFTANCNNDRMQLNWSAPIETKPQYFIIEKSIDGISFKGIGIIQASAIAGEQHQYSYIDTGGLAKTVYYRLKLAHADGSYRFSKTIMGNCLRRNHAFTINPNPTKNGTFYLTLLNDSKVTITASNGVVVSIGNYKAGMQKILLNAVPGTYFVNVSSGDKKTTQILIKQ